MSTEQGVEMPRSNNQEPSDEASCKRNREPENEPAAKIRKTWSSEKLSHQRRPVATLRARLESERDRLADAEKAVEKLRRVVKKTENELEDASNMEKGPTAVVCGCNDILVSRLFPFLEPSDLGRAGQVTRLWRDCCRDERFWKAFSLERWPSTPMNVVTNFRAYYKSQITKRVYEESLTYPHYERQTGEGEEYYVLYELPGFMEDTASGPRPVSRCVKIDESIGLEQSDQKFFEESMCNHYRDHKSAWLGLPLGLVCNPFPTREMIQRVTQLKISILRASDQKMALVMDPSSDRYDASSLGDNPFDGVRNQHYQALGEIPNHLDPESILDDFLFGGAQISALSFRTRASIEVPITGEFVGGDPDDATWRESEELVQVRFTRVLLGFELYDPVENPDAHHMTPPLVDGNLTRFLEMAGVKWF